jgi:methionine-rich copper-binding protein CopC
MQKASVVKLTIYDVLGKEVAVLVNEKLNAGSYSVVWSTIGGGGNYSSGVYFYRLQTDNFSETKRMMLIK